MTGEGGRIHVTCLNCGKQLSYDWDKMEIEGRKRKE
jgi:hypothetical protein